MRHSSARCLQVCRYPLRPTLPLGVCLLRMAERTQELTARSENQAVRRDERCGLTSVEPGLVSECLRCPGAKLASLLGAERACGHGEKGAVQRWQPVSVSNLQRTDDRGLEGNGPKTTSWRKATAPQVGPERSPLASLRPGAGRKNLFCYLTGGRPRGRHPRRRWGRHRSRKPAPDPNARRGLSRHKLRTSTVGCYSDGMYYIFLHARRI